VKPGRVVSPPILDLQAVHPAESFVVGYTNQSKAFHVGSNQHVVSSDAQAVPLQLQTHITKCLLNFMHVKCITSIIEVELFE